MVDPATISRLFVVSPCPTRRGTEAMLAESEGCSLQGAVVFFLVDACIGLADAGLILPWEPLGHPACLAMGTVWSPRLPCHGNRLVTPLDVASVRGSE
jgi:hypothetical protein